MPTTLLHLASRRPQEKEHAVAMIDGAKLLAAGKLSKAQLKQLLGGLLGPFDRRKEFGYRFLWQDPSAPLLYKSHDPQLRQQEEELQAVGGTVHLGELLDSSWRGTVGFRTQATPGEATRRYRVIGSRELRGLTDLSPDDLETVELPESLVPEYQLRPGDVLLGRIWTPAGDLKLGVVAEALAGAVAEDGVLLSVDGICGVPTWEVTIPEYWTKAGPGDTCYKALRTGHIHSGRPGSLARIARFAGSDLAA